MVDFNLHPQALASLEIPSDVDFPFFAIISLSCWLKNLVLLHTHDFNFRFCYSITPPTQDWKKLANGLLWGPSLANLENNKLWDTTFWEVLDYKRRHLLPSLLYVDSWVLLKTQLRLYHPNYAAVILICWSQLQSTSISVGISGNC